MTPDRSQTGITGALLRQARPIGVGPRFQPPATGPVTGRCRPMLRRRHGVHVEVFAANRVVIVPAGVGTRPPRALSAGRISRARCYGGLVTLEPTGVILVRFGRRATVANLFRAWGAGVRVRGRTPLARPALECSARTACRDRAGDRAARPAALVVHLPTGRLSNRVGGTAPAQRGSPLGRDAGTVSPAVEGEERCYRQAAVVTGVLRLRCWIGVEPLRVIDENPKAAVKGAIVPARSRRGVSQVACWAWSHERAPLAPAAAAMTHPAHTAWRVSAGWGSAGRLRGQSLQSWQAPCRTISCSATRIGTRRLSFWIAVSRSGSVKGVTVPQLSQTRWWWCPSPVRIGS